MNVRRAAALVAAVSIVAAGGAPAAADQAPGVPGLNVAITRVSQHSPAYIAKSYWFTSNQGSPGTNFIECIDFRVLSRKTISAVRFTLHFRDDFGNEHFLSNAGGRPWNLERRGNFTPNELVLSNHDPSRTYTNDRSESCWVVPTAFADVGQSSITKMSIETSQVAFTDGTVWNEGQPFDQAFTTTGSPARAPINIAQRWMSTSRAPIEIVRSGTGYDWGGDPQQCITFRNVSGQVASSVDFDVFYLDGSNNRVVSRSVSHAGTFTPPVLIEDKCRNVNLGSADDIKRERVAEIHVRRVVFNDGTQWNEGDGFTRVYGNDGTRLSAPLAVAASNAPFALPTNAPNVFPDVQSFGPSTNTNDNGTSPGGTRYGAIAADGTATYASVAKNYDSPAAAGANAVHDCDVKSGGNTCRVMLTFQHCAAIAVRNLGGRQVGFFSKTDPLDQRAAEIEAISAAGTTDASILASGCNT